MTLTSGAYHTSADWPEIEAVPGVYRRVLSCGDVAICVSWLAWGPEMACRWLDDKALGWETGVFAPVGFCPCGVGRLKLY